MQKAEREAHRARTTANFLGSVLEGVDPDEAYSPIPYEKGARFVALLERTAGPAVSTATWWCWGLGRPAL